MIDPVEEFSPVPKGSSLEYVRVFTEVCEVRLAWQYFACTHHWDQFLKASRAAGDTLRYYVFFADPGLCTICWNLKHGRALRYGLMSQVSLRVDEPQGVIDA